MPVNRGLNSKNGKGRRKTARPKPSSGPSGGGSMRQPKKKASAKQKSKRQLETMRNRRKLDAFIAENLSAVKNPQGRARGYDEVRMFLTVFCELYQRKAAELQGMCVPLPSPPRFPLLLPELTVPQDGASAGQRLHPRGCCARPHGPREC